jgi:hypothetical protein
VICFLVLISFVWKRRGELLRLQRGRNHDRIRLTETDLTVRY